MANPKFAPRLGDTERAFRARIQSLSPESAANWARARAVRSDDPYEKALAQRFVNLTTAQGNYDRVLKEAEALAGPGGEESEGARLVRMKELTAEAARFEASFNSFNNQDLRGEKAEALRYYEEQANEAAVVSAARAEAATRAVQGRVDNLADRLVPGYRVQVGLPATDPADQ